MAENYGEEKNKLDRFIDNVKTLISGQREATAKTTEEQYINTAIGGGITALAYKEVPKAVSDITSPVKALKTLKGGFAPATLTNPYTIAIGVATGSAFAFDKAKQTSENALEIAKLTEENDNFIKYLKEVKYKEEIDKGVPLANVITDIEFNVLNEKNEKVRTLAGGGLLSDIFTEKVAPLFEDGAQTVEKHLGKTAGNVFRGVTTPIVWLNDKIVETNNSIGSFVYKQYAKITGKNTTYDELLSDRFNRDTLHLTTDQYLRKSELIAGIDSHKYAVSGGDMSIDPQSAKWVANKSVGDFEQPFLEEKNTLKIVVSNPIISNPEEEKKIKDFYASLDGFLKEKNKNLYDPNTSMKGPVIA